MFIAPQRLDEKPEKNSITMNNVVESGPNWRRQADISQTPTHKLAQRVK